MLLLTIELGPKTLEENSNEISTKSLSKNSVDSMTTLTVYFGQPSTSNRKSFNEDKFTKTRNLSSIESSPSNVRDKSSRRTKTFFQRFEQFSPRTKNISKTNNEQKVESNFDLHGNLRRRFTFRRSLRQSKFKQDNRFD